MAEEEFEVRGAHEDALERMAERAEPLGQTIALFSALIATLGAVVSLAGNRAQTEAILLKNEAVLLKARASDQWSYYQAEDMKRHLALLGRRLAPAGDTGADLDAERYAARAAALRGQAEALDRQSAAADAASLRAAGPHGRLALATTALQVAIALASITALTGRRWLLGGAYALAAAGGLLAVLAWAGAV